MKKNIEKKGKIPVEKKHRNHKEKSYFNVINIYSMD